MRKCFYWGKFKVNFLRDWLGKWSRNGGCSVKHQIWIWLVSVWMVVINSYQWHLCLLSAIFGRKNIFIVCKKAHFSHTISLKRNMLEYELSYKENENTQCNLGVVQTSKPTVSLYIYIHIYIIYSLLKRSHFWRLFFVTSPWYEWPRSTKQLPV